MTSHIDNVVKKYCNENIAIIGFMATGKTTIAKDISKKTNGKFLDLDFLIEEKCALNINTIFKFYTEEYFRFLENYLLNEVSELLSTNNFVLSVGGGFNKNPKNNLFLKNFKTFFLYNDLEILITRLEQDVTRPLLRNLDSVQKYNAIKDLYDERINIYRNVCDFEIDCNNKSVDEVSNEIIKCLG